MGPHEELPDVARQPDGEDGLHQEGHQEARREGVPEEEVAQSPLHGVGLEDLQHGEVLQRHPARGPRVHAHHHVVGGVGGHSQVHPKVHKAGQEVQHDVRHLRGVLAPEARPLRDSPADKVHCLVAGHHQHGEGQGGRHRGPLAPGVGEGRDVERVGQVAAQRPEGERQSDAEDADDEPYHGLPGRHGKVRPVHGLGLKGHGLQLASSALILGVIVVIAEVEATTAPADGHGFVPGLFRREDDKGHVSGGQAFQHHRLLRNARPLPHPQLQEVPPQHLRRGGRRRLG
mmetsp:Transcript_51459/g.149488  ORF Transcript_51459/g.149488 Transcript_51459/m.149488 type:complete len:287 (+) Transcript_51459:855-1715(+)